jgi:hypothetical protein
MCQRNLEAYNSADLSKVVASSASVSSCLLFVAINPNANMKKGIGFNPMRHIVMQLGRKSPINHRTCESVNARHDVKVDRAAPCSML